MAKVRAREASWHARDISVDSANKDGIGNVPFTRTTGSPLFTQHVVDHEYDYEKVVVNDILKLCNGREVTPHRIPCARWGKKVRYIRKQTLRFNL